jgi:hypothetical protein
LKIPEVFGHSAACYDPLVIHDKAEAHRVALQNTWSALGDYNEAIKENPRNDPKCEKLWIHFTDCVVALGNINEAMKNG